MVVKNNLESHSSSSSNYSRQRRRCAMTSTLVGRRTQRLQSNCVIVCILKNGAGFLTGPKAFALFT